MSRYFPQILVIIIVFSCISFYVYYPKKTNDWQQISSFKSFFVKTGKYEKADGDTMKYSTLRKPNLKSNRRGYVALLYSGTARTFTGNFISHIVNFMAGCPYTVHLFMHAYSNEGSITDFGKDSGKGYYRSINATLEYFEGYINLDNEYVFFRDAVKANVVEYLSVDELRNIYKDVIDKAEKRSHLYAHLSRIFYMWHSQRRSEEFRQKYVADTGIDYKWVFRMRHDAIYFTNWWQRAFNIQVYNPLNHSHRQLEHDVEHDWGIRPTRLYDLVFEPRLLTNKTIYTPFGWDWGGYNDQFAAIPSIYADMYFMRILHVDRMLADGKVHSETSILQLASWYKLNVDTKNATMCYSIVRLNCEFSPSGIHDCSYLCPILNMINEELRMSFYHANISREGADQSESSDIETILKNHIQHINNDTRTVLSPTQSSFFYFHSYVGYPYANDPCNITKPSERFLKMSFWHYLPFILQTEDKMKIYRYRKYATCSPWSAS